MIARMIVLLGFVISLSCVLATPTSNLDGRIVGGDDIPIEEVPYQISLQIGGEHACGGSIIAPTYIVTATHCTIFESEANLSVRVGTSTRDFGGQVVNVKTLYNHPNYEGPPSDYDIAVLELTDNLEFSDKVRPISLPSRTQYWPPGTEVLVTGWGLLNMMDTSLPVNLQGVIVELIDQNTCMKDYGIITERMFCAGVDGGGKDACSSDSGGPLEVEGVLVGIVSWGDGCALKGAPGVYANVSVLLDFVKEVTGL